MYGTTYGLMMMGKIVLLGFVLILAWLNFSLVRAQASTWPAGLLRLRRFGEVEIGIGFTIVLAAASLTSQPPAVDLPNDRATAHEIAERVAPRWPRLETPPLSSLSSPSLQQWKREHRASTDAFVPGAQYGPSTPGDIAWSEYNHHWAGIVVLAMGGLAVLSRSGFAPWARHWPLAFVGLAVFLLLRADPENWPLGPNGFWESFRSADVSQHRLFVLMILLFAAFEWGVQTGRLQSRAALVFPLICAAGGAVLLTHMHALANIKEELLVEFSHVPLAILAVLAGWTRWLELRLPQINRGVPSRI